MLIKNWLAKLTDRLSGPRRGHTARRRMRRQRVTAPLRIAAEVLEERAMLTDIVVTSLGDEDNVDDSPGNNAFDGTPFDAVDNGANTGVTLREAIEIANRNQNNANGGGEAVLDRIIFDAALDGGTIFIQSELPTITDNVQILGMADDGMGGLVPIDITISGDAGGTTGFGNVSGTGDGLENNNVRIVSIDIAFAGDVNAATPEGEEPAVPQDDVRIENIVFENGNAQNGDGGAIRHLNTGELYLVDVAFNTNQANGNGGAIAINAARMFATDTTFQANTADADENDIGDGGAIYQTTGLTRLIESDPGVTETFVNGGNAQRGGGIFSNGGSVIIEAGVDVLNNGDDGTIEGGGLWIGGNNQRHSNGFGYIENLRINGNNILTPERVLIGNTAQSGGAIYMDVGTRGFFDNTIFRNAVALGADPSQGGGALYLNQAADVDVYQSSFESNSATGLEGRGGAIYVITSGGHTTADPGNNDNTALDADLMVVASDFTTNNADKGGAVYITGSGEVQLGSTGDDIDLQYEGAGSIFVPGFGEQGGNLFQFNRAKTDGGAVYIDDEQGAGYLDLEEPEMRDNVAGGLSGDQDGGEAGRGGALFATGNVLVDIFGNTIFGAANEGLFTQNRVDGPTTEVHGGGAIYNDAGSGTTDSGFTAGMDFFGDVNVTNNTAIRGTANGGGIFNTTNGRIGDIDTRISNNTAAGDGGGVFSQGDFDASGTSIASNDSQRGAGFFNNGGTFDATGISITGNEADFDGGGLFNDFGGFVDIAFNSDVDGNDAYGALDGQGGAGIYNRGVLFFQDSSLDSNGRGFSAPNINSEDVAGDRIVITGHRFEEGREIAFFPGNGSVPGGIIAGLTYFVRNPITDRTNPTADSFQVSLTLDGPIVDITGPGTGTRFVSGDMQPDNGGGILNAEGGQAVISHSFAAQDSTITSNEAVFGGGFHNRDTTSNLTIVDTEMKFNDSDERGGAGEIRSGNVSFNDGLVQDNDAGTDGGAFANTGGTLILNNTHVLRNEAQGEGGGIFNDNDPDPEVLGSARQYPVTPGVRAVTQITTATIVLNEANGTEGGGGIYNNARLFLDNSSVNANRANNGDGGGLLNTQDGVATVSRGGVFGNFAGVDGGGISNQGGSFTIDALNVNGNEAVRNGGGLNLLGTESDLSLANGQVNDNIAGANGGGIFTEGDINLTTVAVNRNTANGTANGDGGGGIFIQAGGSATIDDSTVNQNTSANDGGGILASPGTTLTITNSDVSSNTAAGNGGAIEVASNDQSTATITDTTINGNTAGTFNTELVAGDVVIVGYRSDDVDVDVNNGNDQAFAFVNLVDLLPGQTIFITDSGVENDLLSPDLDPEFVTNEGAISYTAPATGLVAGTVITVEFSFGGGVYTFSDATLAQAGTFAGANDANVGTNGLNISGTGDNLFVYSGTSADPNFLHGLKTRDGFFNDVPPIDTEEETELPTGLVTGVNGTAVALGNAVTDSDNARFTGSFAGTRNEILTDLANAAQWEQTVDPGTIPFTGPPNDSDVAFGRSKYTVTDLANSDGGGIHVTGESIVTVTGGSLNDNRASGDGGALYNSDTGTLTVTNATIDGNEADRGAGLFQSDGPLATGTSTIQTSTISNGEVNDSGAGVFTQGATTNVLTSTISGNTASLNGGGLVQDVAGDLNVQSSTVAFNTAGEAGGGIFKTPGSGTLHANSNIVAGNMVLKDPDGAGPLGPLGPDVFGTLTGDLNILQDDGTDNTLVGIGNQNGVDPLIGALADNGGPTLTHALLVGSPAIDAGRDASGIGTDQRGFTRPFLGGGVPVDDGSDVGAFESQVPPLEQVGLNGGTNLVLFNDRRPDQATDLPILGLLDGENVIALDSRIEDGLIYAVTDRNNVYTIDTTTGQATLVSALTQGLNDNSAETLDQDRNFFFGDNGLFENSFGLGEKWFKGDDLEMTGNNDYYITPLGDIFKWIGGGTAVGDILVGSIGANAYHDLSLIVEAFDAFGGAPPAAVVAVDEEFRLFRASRGNFFANLLGQGEKWVRGFDGSLKWYIIVENLAGNADVREWDGTMDGANTIMNSPIVEDDMMNVIGADLPIAILDNPDLLTKAADPAMLQAGLDAVAETEDENRDFHFARKGSHGTVGQLWENFLGLGEKWFRGDSVTNTPSWYYITPNGDIFTGGGTFVTNVGPAYDNLDLIVEADTPFDDLAVDDMEEARALDFAHRFFRATKTNAGDSGFFFNSGGVGANEKWLVGKTNVHGNRFYVIRQDDTIVAWNGVGIGGTVLGNVAGAWENPEILYQAYDNEAVLGDTDGTFTEFAADFKTGVDTVTTGNLVTDVDDHLRFFAQNGADLNLKIDVDTGLVEEDTAPFNDLFAIASNGTFFGINFATDELVTIDPETGGILTTIGALNLGAGIDALDGGLDFIEIGGESRLNAALRVDDGLGGFETRFYNIDTTTGAAKALGANNGLVGLPDVFDDITDFAFDRS